MKKLIIFIFLVINYNIYAQRVIISLNGTWELTESLKSFPVPGRFNHSVQVPGLANQAKPPFENVGKFYGVDYLHNSWVQRNVDGLPPDTSRVGTPEQNRNYFWYRKEFTLAGKNDIILLKINKAQFGTAVWINGKLAGTHQGCFTAGYFDITKMVKQPGQNTVIIRIGAHPGVLPVTVPTGSDYEKPKWTPGIYDEVSVMAGNYPFILHDQVAPQISNSTIKVQSVILNDRTSRNLSLDYTIYSFPGNQLIAHTTGHELSLMANDTVTITETIPVPGAKLWTPETPNLYIVKTSTGNDELNTRFGMREFHFDTETKKAYLNGKIYYLRGSNITLHRFFDDDSCGNKPWDEKWVRKLLVDWPRKFNWNSFRFCIGPVPDKWLNIADESGLLIQNEFFIWPYHAEWDTVEIRNEIEEWMRDNENHPSVAWWDICNETDHQELRDIIKRVRHLDLSGRAWDNGYGLPVGNNDPVEDHHYLSYNNSWGLGKFEKNVAAKTLNSPHPTAHSCVLNEYGWLWLDRQGTPTLLTRNVYDKIAAGFTKSQRIELAAYLLGIETEYFRAHRNYAGVLHFTFLTGNYTNQLTGDLFSDISNLVVYPSYYKYLSEAFRPLGVFIDFTSEVVEPEKNLSLRIMFVNDEYKNLSGSLTLRLTDENGKDVYQSEKDFEVDALGQQTVEMFITTPAGAGNYRLTATATSPGEEQPTVSIRKFSVVEKK